MAFGHSNQSPAATRQWRCLCCAGLSRDPGLGGQGAAALGEAPGAGTGGWYRGLAPGAGFVPCRWAGLRQGLLPVGNSWAAWL